MAGSAAVSVSAKEGLIHTDEIPDLLSIDAKAGILKGSALYHENGYYETIDLAAAELSELQKRSIPPRLADGKDISGFLRQPNHSAGPIHLKIRHSKRRCHNPADNGESIKLDVAEIAAYDTFFLRHTRGATALLPLSFLHSLLGYTDGYSEILIKPSQGVSAETLKKDLETALPAETYRITETFSEDQVTADARQKSMPFFLISFFSLTMSIFIIYSSYKVITLERLPIIGTFRSIGAAQKNPSQAFSCWKAACTDVSADCSAFRQGYWS